MKFNQLFLDVDSCGLVLWQLRTGRLCHHYPVSVRTVVSLRRNEHQLRKIRFRIHAQRMTRKLPSALTIFLDQLFSRYWCVACVHLNMLSVYTYVACVHLCCQCHLNMLPVCTPIFRWQHRFTHATYLVVHRQHTKNLKITGPKRLSKRPEVYVSFFERVF